MPTQVPADFHDLMAGIDAIENGIQAQFFRAGTVARRHAMPPELRAKVNAALEAREREFGVVGPAEVA